MLSNPKTQVSLVIASTLLAGFSLGSLLGFTDPFSASIFTIALFYVSLFLFTLGGFTLLGLGLRKWASAGLYIINLGNSFRQAFLMAVLVTVSFILLSQRLLFWWVEGSLILLLLTIEAFLNLKV